MRTLGFVMLALGAIATLISLPLLGFAALGFLGILADVSTTENRGFGLQLLSIGLPPLLCGVVLCAIGLLAMKRSHRHSDAEPGRMSPGGGV